MFFGGGDPFEHFAGMHGGPGGGGSSRRGPSRDVDTTKLYETLGVSHTMKFFCHFFSTDHTAINGFVWGMTSGSDCLPIKIIVGIIS